MKALVLFMIVNLYQFYSIRLTEGKTGGKVSQNKTLRDIEAYTTIFLDNESFSIESGPNYPPNKSDLSPGGGKDGDKRIGRINHHSKANYERQPDTVSSSKNSAGHNAIIYQKQHQDRVAKRSKNITARYQKKTLHKRHYEMPIGYYNNRISEVKRSKIENDFRPTYSFVLTEATQATKNNLTMDGVKSFHAVWENPEHVSTTKHSNKVPSYAPFFGSMASPFFYPSNSRRSFSQNLEKSRMYKKMPMNPMEDDDVDDLSAIKTSETWLTSTVPPMHTVEFHQADAGKKKHRKDEDDYFAGDEYTNPWENAEHGTTIKHSKKAPIYAQFSGSMESTLSYPSNSRRSFSQNLEKSRLYKKVPMNPMEDDDEDDLPAIRSTETLLTSTVPPVQTMEFHQADIIQRHLAAAEKKEQMKNEKDYFAGDQSGFDDTLITFDVICDNIVNQTCTVQREVGDVLTLALKINSSKKLSSFQIRWMKIYHKFDSNTGQALDIEPGKLPWNMVSGSEGRELRLNPVTNSDIDPNCFIAHVFGISKKHGKELYTQLKKMVFRIEIPIIDMGKLYAGEELSIHIENFVSLPERGDLLFQWNIETRPQEYESLPSNIKVSNSGRSVVLKELKKGPVGVLNCVIYSSNRYAVAKRRFNILKIVENVKRRSTSLSLAEDPLPHDLQKSRRCRHIIRRSQEEAKQKLIDGNKPKSRRKRFRRRESLKRRSSEMDCEPLRKKMYSRYVRSLLRMVTTEDPRLMPLEKLLDLSEEGDGTLDHIIPHEVHIVSPKVRLISGTSAEKTADHSISKNCTSHTDCTENAACVFPEDQINSTVRIGNCYCRPEFYRDGFTCRKIPLSSHREKRLKRNARNDFAVPQHLFYRQNSPEIVRSTPETPEEDEDTEHPKILAFEEEESFLLSDCIDDKDCSMHAICVQPNNGHPYCKCRPGFRGNGIFCWETMDYVPADEQFLSDAEINTMNGAPFQAELPMNRMALKTIEPPEVEEEV